MNGNLTRWRFEDHVYSWDDWRDPWFGDDKIAHALGGAALWLLLDRLGWASSGWWVLAVGVTVEVVELVRYRHWLTRGRPQPWPFLTDKISRKDIVWDLMGAGAAWCAVWIGTLL